MREINLKELLEAGCHFGHQTNRWHPGAASFIWSARDGVHIIDLAKTKLGLEQAGAFVKNLGSLGGSIIFVSSKNQAKTIVRQAVEHARKLIGQNKEGVIPNQASGGIFYVDERWVGGLITNFDEVSKNFQRLKDLQKKTKETQEYTKKEIADFGKEITAIKRFYQGLLGLKSLPEALFLVDANREKTALREARRKNVKIVAIIDTNADPRPIDYPIPSNDDAVGAITLITEYLAQAYAEGAKAAKKRKHGKNLNSAN